jgi:AcrR family transcriptional regulator
MSELEKGPQGRRRGQGARERILGAAQQLFREQGINNTGMDQLCAVAQVSKRTAYQHFGSKDELIAEYLRRHDPDTMPEVFERTDLPARERLLAVFEKPLELTYDVTPLCPFIAAAVEIADPEHPARVRARQYKESVAARLTETAREAGAADPELLGEQLALLFDGASARTRTLGIDVIPTAAGIAATLIEQAIPETAPATSAAPSPRAPSQSQATRTKLPPPSSTPPSEGPRDCASVDATVEGGAPICNSGHVLGH